MAAQSPVVTSQGNMTVSPAQMMHPVSQMIQPLLKEALPTGPQSERTADRRTRRCYDVLMLSKDATFPPFSDASSGAAFVIFPAECRDERRSQWRCSDPPALIGLS